MGFIVLWLNGIGIIESELINWLVLFHGLFWAWTAYVGYSTHGSLGTVIDAPHSHSGNTQ